MAAIEEKALNFIWKIENYSYYLNPMDNLRSPDFRLNVFEGSSWCLQLYPRGVPSYENYVSVHLMRLPSSSGPQEITIDYEIAILRSDGTVECAKKTTNRCFRKGFIFGFDDLAIRDEILRTKRSILLPEDILTVQCSIFQKGTPIKRNTKIIAKTHVELERTVFRWNSENYFSEKLNEFGSIMFLNDIRPLQMKLYWNTVDGVEYLNIWFTNFYDYKVLKCKMYILDVNYLISQCIMDEYIDAYKNEFRLIAADEIRKQKSLLLPNDKLTLQCDFTCSFRIQYNQIEVVAFDDAVFSDSKSQEASSEIDATAETQSNACEDIYDSFKNDFQTLYLEGTLCDFTLNVGKEGIQALKAVLVARSPVFKFMLTSNMKENEKNSVDISDLDANTVRCMLKFLYTDATGDLDWEDARKLYIAADKYGIMKLKSISADVLKRNLCVSSAGATLALAHLHGDECLRDLTIEYISKNDTEILCSTEWKDLMVEDPLLAAETMRQIFIERLKNKRRKV